MRLLRLLSCALAVVVAVAPAQSMARGENPTQRCGSIDVDGSRVAVVGASGSCRAARSAVEAAAAEGARETHGYVCRILGLRARPLLVECTRGQSAVWGLAVAGSGNGGGGTPWWLAVVTALSSGAIAALIAGRYSARVQAAAGRVEQEVQTLVGLRDAYRGAVPPEDVAEMSALAARLVATGRLIHTAGTKERYSDLLADGAALTERFRTLQHRMRIFGDPLAEAMIQLGNVPRYAAAYLDSRDPPHVADADAAREYIARANRLRDELYAAVRALALEGRALTTDEEAALVEADRRLKEHWEATNARTATPPGGASAAGSISSAP